MWFRSAFNLLKAPGAGTAIRSAGSRASRRQTPRLLLEALEDRTVPSTFTVLNLADSGAGSLRQAILDANANPGADLIRFGPHARDGTVPLTGGELSITDSLTIDGLISRTSTRSSTDRRRGCDPS